jgi:hypothetical protein
LSHLYFFGGGVHAQLQFISVYVPLASSLSQELALHLYFGIGGASQELSQLLEVLSPFASSLIH